MTLQPLFSCSRWRDWLKVFGPGAIIASLPIGAGELVFSSRGGSLFDERLLWYSAIILLEYRFLRARLG